MVHIRITPQSWCSTISVQHRQLLIFFLNSAHEYPSRNYSKNHRLYYLNCLNCHKNLIIRNYCFNFQVYRIEQMLSICKHNIIRRLYTSSLQIGNISSISDKLQNLKSFLKCQTGLKNIWLYSEGTVSS
jgi:hypothetical protein